MSTKVLSRVLQVLVAGAMLVGGMFFFFMAPLIIDNYAVLFPEFAFLAIPLKILTAAAYVPVIAGMIAVILMLGSIARGAIFTAKNAYFARLTGVFALAALALFTAEFAVMIMFGAANPPVFYFYLVALSIGIVVALAAFLVRRVVHNAIVPAA